MSSGQVNQLAMLKPRRIFLALDNDKAGQDGIEKNIKELLPLTDAAIRVVGFDTAKDADEMIFKHGKAAFQSALLNSVDAAKWLARRA